MGLLGVWWRRADHYDQLSSLLEARRMCILARSIISVIAGGLVLDALATIWTPTGPQTGIQIGCAVAASVGAAAGSLLWAVCWPTRVQAITFAVVSNASIALIALAQSDPIVEMFTCTTFAAMAFYIALFHTPRLMAYNFAVAIVVAASAGLRIAAMYHVVGAACGLSLVLLLNLAVPFGIQAVVYVLGADAMRAERDQLTGLLNRRAFDRYVKARIAQDRELSARLVVTMIDLDRFKFLNDQHGHSAGDAALVAVARALRECTDDTALLARVGGEEFVIADFCDPDEVQRRAQRLCDAIAALPFGLTASVGTAGADRQPVAALDARAAFDDRTSLHELICAADAAMYVAKRRGGNQTWHHQGDYRNDGISA
ncbi:GGDEF domain-containing protein [Mycobacterium sp. TY815]|uniref:GGDEF domain-containing protein n=1 Tax=Mycobacterium sp. TY815 TaxID=3050581 RepID=UPI002740D060|nr:GGDEF domain-containing protein [Mycobacterium sp. TY815]MDP7706197.1 GGDEF domain-containing protein [Mycobacterium sp. TY815]